MKTKSTNPIITIVSMLMLIGSSVASAQGGPWSTVAPLPFGRTQASGVSLNGIVYSIGGWNGGCSPYANLEAYDPATNTWSERAPLLSAVSEPVAGVIDGKIYVSTGSGSSCGAPPSDITAVYDPAANSWTLKAPNPQARSGAGGGVIDGKLYVVGGNSGDGLAGSRMDIYDPVSDSWSAGAAMPTARNAFVSVVVNGILYAIAGMTDAGPTAAVEAYDPSTHKWTSKAALPVLDFWSAEMATTLNGRIYVCGGAKVLGTFDQGAAPSNGVYVYDPGSDSWTASTSMPIAHALDTAVANGGKIYVFGGDSSFTPDTLTTEVDVFTLPLVDTPQGSNVTVDLGSVGPATVAITFAEVGTEGGTAVVPIDPIQSFGYQLVSADLAFDISTSAKITAPIVIAFQVPSLDSGTFASLRVFHNENGTMVDRTADDLTDVANQIIYARVSSLSPFVLAKPVYHAAVRQPIEENGSSVFTAKRGVVPIKFTLTFANAAVCNLPAATLALWRIAGSTTGSVNESIYLTRSNSGSTFRNEDCQYVYNLNAAGFGAGTYRVDVNVAGNVVGTASFKLK